MHAIALALLLSTSSAQGLCFLQYDEVSGFNRICHYSCLSGDVDITVDALEFCPWDISDEG